MLLRLVIAELRHRPGRALFLLAGYSLGVSVMVVLLAVGEAMLEQARDQALVGGGDVVVVPAGISAEMLKAGGVSSLFLGIDHARFVQREVLESRRGREEYGIVAASPVLDGRLLELSAGGRRFPAVAGGEIPSRARLAGASPLLLTGSWEDSDEDRRWVDPAPGELFRRIDRFHLPTGQARDSTWAEWHYFNVVLDEERWLYLTLLVGGEVGIPGRWGGRVLMTVRERGDVHRSFSRDVDGSVVVLDTTAPDLRLGEGSHVTLVGDAYRVVAQAEGRRVDLTVRPTPGRYFPATDLGGGTLISGYVVPALHAVATGTVCLPRCESVRGLQAYHDHNWGVWREVSWEWGAASSPRTSLLYGLVRGGDDPGGASGPRGVFAYLVDDRGVRGLFRPADIRFEEVRTVQTRTGPVEVPERLSFEDARRGFRVDISVDAAHVTDMRRARRRYFVQMRGIATVRQVGRAPERLPGFFETYVDR